MAPTFLDALTLSRFAVYLRPHSEVFYLPGFKGAAFRGGFGYAFKSIACPTHDVDCIHQRLGAPCVYSEVFETPVPRNSAIMRKYPKAPHPFILTPPLSRCVSFPVGQELRLELVLVGRAINWLAYFIYAFEELGRRGVGPVRARYGVERVQNLSPCHSATGEAPGVVYDGKERRVVGAPYVLKGSSFSAQWAGLGKITLRFVTPARVVSDAHLSSELPFATLLRSLIRRQALLAYFHCNQSVDAAVLRDIIRTAEGVRVAVSTLRWHDLRRFSTRQQADMKLGGLMGEITYEGALAPFMPFLRAGELTHLGKATSFGLGKYELRES